MMKDRGLLSHSIEILFLTLGIYLIIVNLLQLSYNQQFLKPYDSVTLAYNFEGWHKSNIIEFRGFGWFFSKLETYPGLQNVSDTIQDFQELAMTTFSDENLADLNVFKVLNYLLNTIFLPFKTLGCLIYDIISSLVWFFSFLIGF